MFLIEGCLLRQADENSLPSYTLPLSKTAAKGFQRERLRGGGNLPRAAAFAFYTLRSTLPCSIVTPEDTELVIEYMYQLNRVVLRPTLTLKHTTYVLCVSSQRNM